MNTKNHKEWVKEVFDSAAYSYGKKGCSYFDVFGKGLVSKTNLVSGERLLDVATGKGAILFPAAEIVGGGGSVIGIDISPEMISECRRNTIPSWVQLEVMDAENLAFSDSSFDVVCCGFALFFLPDIKRALFEFKRVLKHNGRLGSSVWGKISHLTQWIIENAKKYGAVKPLRTCTIDSPIILRKTLDEAGFKNIEIYEDIQSFWHESAEEWWNSLWTHAVRAYLEQLAKNNLEELHQEALRYGAEISKNGRIQETMHAIYAICRKE